ncbi:MAG: FHA domain-containing protein [Deltaproteobacteria bacterium]|nr:FHA domain-containing protein [Deltaproteobacteria bacterium]
MPRITLMQTGRTLWTNDFVKDYITIGRHAFADISLDSPLVSRHHAVIRYSAQEGGFIVEDNGSSNGIRVNTVDVKKAKLRDGDKIQVGGYVIVFEKGKTGLDRLSSHRVRQKPKSGIMESRPTLVIPGGK